MSLQSAAETPDAFGDGVQAWSTVASMRAEVKALGGNELWRAQQVDALAEYQVTIRWYSGSITTKMRFLWGSTPLPISSILGLDKHDRDIVILCKGQGS